MKKWLLPIIQTGILGLFALSFYAASWVGEEYVLRAEPYDPFDPFYGEYVLLQYPDLTPPESADYGTVYFTLKEGADGYAVLDKVENRFFWGAIKGFNSTSSISAPQLEQFYVEQGRGPELEAAVDLQVTVDVAPWGVLRPKTIDVRDN